jgi:hypothetical protein
MKRKLWFCRRDDNDEETLVKPEDFLFQGSRTAVVKWLKTNNLWREYKRGKIRMGYFI